MQSRYIDLVLDLRPITYYCNEKIHRPIKFFYDIRPINPLYKGTQVYFEVPLQIALTAVASERITCDLLDYSIEVEKSEYASWIEIGIFEEKQDGLTYLRLSPPDDAQAGEVKFTVIRNK
jgi:hypothetical protein